LFLSSLFPADARAVERGERIPLWPIYYRAHDDEQNTREILWPLWSSSDDLATSHTVSSLLWPVSRFSHWHGSGDANSYVFPFFWGNNRPEGREDPALAPNSYFFAVPIHWWWRNARAGYRIVPPFYDFRYADGEHRWGAYPLLWRTVDGAKTSTILVPFWWKTYPLGFKSGGVFPLVWIFNHEMFKAYVAAPAWYAKHPDMRTFGVAPLFFYVGKEKERDYWTNVLLLGNIHFEKDRYKHSLYPLVRFSADPANDRKFQMIFPFWWGRNKEHVYACTFPFAWSWDREEKKIDNWSIVPLYWRFRDMNSDDAFPLDDLDALFPIYGRNRGPGEDQRWSFFAFPLFVHARKGDEQTWWLPFPLAGHSVTSATRSTWLFPLFDTERTPSEKKFGFGVLLGFLTKYSRSPGHYHWEALRYSFLLPPVFYIDRAKSEEGTDSIGVKLSALYQYRRNLRDFDWSVLLFLASGHRSESVRWWKILVEPFISSKETGTMKRRIVTPLYYDRTTYEAHKLDEPATPTARLNVLFPLTYYERNFSTDDRPDRVKFSLLDPLSLLRDEEDVQRHYSALFHLYDYKRRDSGRTDSRVLWRAWHRTVDGDRRALEVFPFINTEKAPESRRFSVGWRLFDYRREGEKKSLRLFFMPAIRWGGDAAE
jgi:hypothetical protein